jgi:hypothetical protein
MYIGITFLRIQKPQGLLGGLRSVKWVKEWTEGWLSVRLGQVRSG